MEQLPTSSFNSELDQLPFSSFNSESHDIETEELDDIRSESIQGYINGWWRKGSDSFGDEPLKDATLNYTEQYIRGVCDWICKENSIKEVKITQVEVEFHEEFEVLPDFREQFEEMKFKVIYEQNFNPKHAEENGRVKPLAIHFRQVSNKQMLTAFDANRENIIELNFYGVCRRGS